MNYYEFLRKEMLAAFGCTEPVALALAAAKAKELLEVDPTKIVARCSGNIIKNTKAVIVPNTGGRKGIEIAVVVGAIAGDSSKDLEVLNNIPEDKILEADKLVREGICEVVLVEGIEGLYIDIQMWDKDGNNSRIVVQNEHNNVIRATKNDVVIEENEEINESETEMDFSFDSIYNFSLNEDYGPIRDLLDMQIEYNLAIAEEGLRNEWGAGIGKSINEVAKSNKDIGIAYAAAGSDARMSGCELPVVINSGSGNQGLTVSLPVIKHAELENKTDEMRYRALIFSNLLAAYQKQGIGRLSAYCGVVSAASAALAGIAFLDEVDKEIIEQTIINGLAVTSGMICDGAKPSCAGKIAAAINTAYMGYNQAKTGRSYEEGDGVVRSNVDETIRSIGRIARYGMHDTDIEILNEMIKNE